MTGPRRKPALPVIRLGLVQPLTEELERRRVDYQSVLAEFSLQPEDIGSGEIFVPAPTMYAIVERLAERSGDPYFGASVGQQLDPWSWSPMKNAAGQAHTVGDFLLHFMSDAGQDESSVTFILKTIGDRSTFHERRFSDGGVFPRHNDAFTVTYLLTILRGAVGKRWQGRTVVARLCDPGALPVGYLGIRTAITDTLGPSISFPAGWLTARLAMKSNRTVSPKGSSSSLPASSIVDSFRQVVLPHIHEPDLDVNRAARLCEMSKRTLARRLQQQGTSINGQISNLRRKRAERELRNTDQSVAAIATKVGYLDATVFSRAFKRWTGHSPSQFRQRRGS